MKKNHADCISCDKNLYTSNLFVKLWTHSGVPFFARAHGSNNKASKLWRWLNCNILVFRKLYNFSQKKWLNLWTHLWGKYIVIIKWSLFKLITQFTRYIGGDVHISIFWAIGFQQMVSLDTNLEFNLFYHFATLIKLLWICLLL